MKRLKQVLLTALTIIPVTAFAHGEEVLPSGFIGLILFILFPVFLLSFKLNRKGQLMISIVYILSIILTLSGLDKFSYNDNMTAINITIIVAPVTIVLLTYVALKRKFPKKGD